MQISHHIHRQLYQLSCQTILTTFSSLITSHKKIFHCHRPCTSHIYLQKRERIPETMSPLILYLHSHTRYVPIQECVETHPLFLQHTAYNICNVKNFDTGMSCGCINNAHNLFVVIHLLSLNFHRGMNFVILDVLVLSSLYLQ